MKNDKAQGGFGALNRQRLVQYFFFGVFLLILYQAARMLRPFAIAVLGSAVLAVMIYPLHAWVGSKLPRFPSWAAALSTSLAVLTVVIPVLLVGWLAIKETGKVYPAAKEWAEGLRGLPPDQLQRRLPPAALAAWERGRSVLSFWNIDLQEIALKYLDEVSTDMGHMATVLIRNTVYVAFNLVILTFTLFFFLRDGPFIIRRLTELVPMAADHKRAILERIENTLYAVIRGLLTVAAVQGLLTGLGFAAAGVPFAVLLGVVAVFLAPIPFIGVAAVWVPVVAWLFATDQPLKATYLLVWCVAVVSTVDNLLRPLLIGAHAKIPILLLFFGLLGGLRVYGPAGLLLGPIIIALALAFVNIYREEYRWMLQEIRADKD